MARYRSSSFKRSMICGLLVGCGWLAGAGALAFSQSKEPSPKGVKIDHFKPVVLFQSDIPVEVTEADIRHIPAATNSELSIVLRNATGGRVNRFVIALSNSDGQGHILGGAAIARAWDIKDEEKTDFSMGLKSQIWNEITKATPVFLAIESVESTVGTWKIDPAAFDQVVREIRPGDSATPSGPPAAFEPAPTSTTDEN